jgi:hypothetical protein
VSQESTNRSFDELARALAEGSISRRRALKLFAGTAIAALIPSRALADDDDDDCVRICHVPFDRQTGQCFFGQRENRCVSRSRLRVHLDEHPCDCRGRCRNCRRPMCQPFGVECTANDQCCSGVCASSEPEQPRICNDPCPVGRVPLSNGTCAVPCTTLADCVPPGGTISNCEACSAEADTGQGFCAGAEQGTNCEQVGTIGCPVGEFCVAGTCVARCNPE